MSKPTRIRAQANRNIEDGTHNPAGSAEVHKGNAAGETALNARVGFDKKTGEEKPVAFEVTADCESAKPMEDEAAEEEEISSEYMIQALEGVMQQIEEVKLQLGYDPDSALFRSLQDVLEAVTSMQASVIEDARQNPGPEAPVTAAAPLTQPTW